MLSSPDEHFLEDYDVFNTKIHGHNDDDNGASDGDEGTTESTPYYSTVEVVTPEDAIRMEKCIVFTKLHSYVIANISRWECL